MHQELIMLDSSRLAENVLTLGQKSYMSTTSTVVSPAQAFRAPVLSMPLFCHPQSSHTEKPNWFPCSIKPYVIHIWISLSRLNLLQQHSLRTGTSSLLTVPQIWRNSFLLQTFLHLLFLLPE